MRKHVFLVIAAVLVLSGCATEAKDFPAYDQELVYDKSYDYTYLKVLEALNTFPGWILEETDKVKGLIVIRNTEYGHLFDRDKWVAHFTVKSLGRKKTSVFLQPSSQRLEQGGEFLKRIDDVMLASLAVKGENQAQLVS
ncbi:MAG: hypothetical protein HY583_03265 [Candidatus Omnitrophica bacterium]|nr:hypothetical protein [Candidatus Omnitrophota bacterium]